MRKFIVHHFYGFIFAGLLLGYSTANAEQPVIDMHFHAWPYGEDGPPDRPKNIAAMNRLLDSQQQNNVVLAATSGPQAFLQRWKEAAPERLLLGPVLPCEGGVNPNWFQYRCFESGAELPDPDWLRKQYESGEYQIMGEIYTQYAGLSYDDPRMDPYYQMAEQLGIPVGFHTHSAPPLTADRCCPNFRLAHGDPMGLENVLVRYPKLKVWIMHANPLAFPLTLDLLKQYPKVYVELSPFQKTMRREKFYRLLRSFQEAGLLDRVMFGTDGHDIAEALEVYRGADFLTDSQLEGILCTNAARFLRRRELCDT